MNKIVIATDSFKGSLSSLQVAEAISQGISILLPTCQIVQVAMADGGEGTIEALITNLKGSLVQLPVSDPLLRPVSSFYGILPHSPIFDSSAVIIESAQACGLPLLSPDEYNPMETSTFGVGELILDALQKGFRHFLIGLGGSATNDAGMGMLSALGFRFYDDASHLLAGKGANLEKVANIDTQLVRPEILTSHFVVACDVDNSLYGPDGASLIFSPQKGASPQMALQLDHGMEHFAKVVQTQLGWDLQKPGSGAAGGLGGAFFSFLHARLTSGVDMILDAVSFDSLLADVDLVITGEGRFDRQTVQGKTPWGVMKRAAKHDIPVIALAGSVSDDAITDGFAGVYPISDASQSLEEALQPTVTRSNLIRTVQTVLKDMNRLI